MGGLLNGSTPSSELVGLLKKNSGSYTWVAAVIGSQNAASYQLSTGDPVMAIGGFNGTDPSPTLEEFHTYVAERQIHYFIRGKMMIGRWGGASSVSRESTDIAEWVETHYTPLTVDNVLIYDLTQPPRNS